MCVFGGELGRLRERDLCMSVCFVRWSWRVVGSGVKGTVCGVGFGEICACVGGRKVRIHGGFDAVIDFRGLDGNTVLHTNGLIKFEAITIFHEVKMEEGDVNSVILPVDEGANVILKDVVLRTEQCMLNSVPWPQHLMQSELGPHHGTMCYLTDGGFQLKNLVQSLSETHEIRIETAHMYCDDMVNNNMQQTQIGACKQELESSNASRYKTALLVGLALAGSVLLSIAITLICRLVLKKLKQRMLNASDSMQSAAVDIVTDFLTSEGCGHSVHMSFNGLELCGAIGKGGFSTVYHGKFQGIPVAVKVIENCGTYCGHSKQSFEAYISSSISHPNVARVLSYMTCTGNQSPPGFRSLDSVHERIISTSNASEMFDMVELSCRLHEKDFSR